MLKRIEKMILRLFRGPEWQVRFCYWPYPEGYAVFNEWRHFALDTGLSKEHAQSICDRMNKGE